MSQVLYFAMGQIKIAVVGDLQKTHLIERWILQRELNADVANILFDQLSDEKITHAVFLGDFVANGINQSEWKIIGMHLENLRCIKLGIIGNHDYGWPGSSGKNSFLKLFSTLSTFNSVALEEHLLIFVDSNFDRLSPADYKRQYLWFRNLISTAGSFEKLYIFSHHPPFSRIRNSKNGSALKTHWIPFVEALRKNYSWFSGHVHAYEEFSLDFGRFYVSGCAGAPRVYDPFIGGLWPHHYLILQNEYPTLRVISGKNAKK